MDLGKPIDVNFSEAFVREFSGYMCFYIFSEIFNNVRNPVFQIMRIQFSFPILVNFGFYSDEFG